jgi:hypothetical protein
MLADLVTSGCKSLSAITQIDKILSALLTSTSYSQLSCGSPLHISLNTTTAEGLLVSGNAV